jgi:hypothetical protein
MKIVAFAHRKRVGKDTAAKFLDTIIRISRPGFQVKKVSFASKLKDVCYQLYGWDGLQPAIFYEAEQNAHLREIALPTIGKSPRQIWIEAGNKLRDVYSHTWVDYALRGIKTDVLIITDLRFENEAKKVHELGGKIFKIIRPDVEVSNDASDSALDNYTEWDGILNNDGTLQQFHWKIEKIAEDILHG